jgi:hypothetical protein
LITDHFDTESWEWWLPLRIPERSPGKKGRPVSLGDAWRNDCLLDYRIPDRNPGKEGRPESLGDAWWNDCLLDNRIPDRSPGKKGRPVSLSDAWRNDCLLTIESLTATQAKRVVQCRSVTPDGMTVSWL